jgi:hypothetical protein
MTPGIHSDLMPLQILALEIAGDSRQRDPTVKVVGRDWEEI